MKTPPIIAAVLFAAVACLAACSTDPAAIARQQKAAQIGNKLLDFGVKRGIISADEAQDFRDLGEIILEAPAEDKSTIPAPDAANPQDTSAKNPPNLPVSPLGFHRHEFGPPRPQYCEARPRAPPIG